MVNRATIPFVKIGRARNSLGEGEHWQREELSPTLNLFDMGDTRSVVAVLNIEGLDCVPQRTHSEVMS